MFSHLLCYVCYTINLFVHPVSKYLVTKFEESTCSVYNFIYLCFPFITGEGECSEVFQEWRYSNHGSYWCSIKGSGCPERGSCDQLRPPQECRGLRPSDRKNWESWKVWERYRLLHRVEPLPGEGSAGADDWGEAGRAQVARGLRGKAVLWRVKLRWKRPKGRWWV